MRDRELIMRNGWILAIAIAAGLAVVVLVTRGWRSEPMQEAAGAKSVPRADSNREGAPLAGGDTSTARRQEMVKALQGGSRQARDAGPSDEQGSDGKLVTGSRPVDGDRHDAMKSSLAQHAEREANRRGDQVGDAAPEVAYEGGATHTFSTNAHVQVADAGPISGESGTVSFWLRPGWESKSEADATFVMLGDSGMQIVKNVNFLRFEYVDSTGVERALGTDIAAWQAGEWRQVTATWDYGSMQLYVDGKLVSKGGYPDPPDFQEETKLYVGSKLKRNTPIAPGELSYLTVLNRSSSADEIGSSFESGPRPSR
jgi:hypothetical protein